MKKSFLSIIMCLTSLVSWAYDVKVDGIYYNVVSKAKVAEVTSGDTEYSGSVIIPEEITFEGVSYSVTSIGKNAFYNCINLTSVTIPNSVTSSL